jgi:acetyltransferase-like isoleucine patch superfamily enzyme
MGLKQIARKFSWFINRVPGINSLKLGKAKVTFSTTLLVGCKLKSKGQDNKILFHGNGGLKNTRITIHGNGNMIEFAEGVSMDGGDIVLDGDCNHFIVGKDTKFCGKIHIAIIEGTSVCIGERGLFSSGITIRTGDSHSVLNLQGERINESKDVTIGNHVWVGNHVIITKGVKIADDSVVGTGSVVTSGCQEKNVVLAGVPAKVVKREITWCPERIPVEKI